MPEENSQLHAIIRGRVQGVGFRYFVLRLIGGRPITGWVRNRMDGSVEVLAEGPRPALEALLAALHAGPRAAHITRVEVGWNPATGEYSEFELRLE